MALFPVNKLEEAKITSYRKSEFTEAKDLTRISRPSKGHRWNFEIKTIWLNRLEHREVFAFLHSLDGVTGIFQLLLPDYSYPFNERLVTNPVADGAHPEGRPYIDLNGLPPNSPKIVTAGDFFKVSGTGKVYMVKETATSDSLGSARIQISPNLYDNISGGTPIIFNGVQWDVELQKDPVELKREANRNKYVKYSLKVQEAKR